MWAATGRVARHRPQDDILYFARSFGRWNDTKTLRTIKIQVIYPRLLFGRQIRSNYCLSKIKSAMKVKHNMVMIDRKKNHLNDFFPFSVIGDSYLFYATDLHLKQG